MKTVLLILCATTIMISCSPQVKYEKGIAEEHGTPEWGPVEIKGSAEKMVDAMYNYLINDWGDAAYIEVRNFRNRTSEHIDTRMITDEVVTHLVQRRIKFLDDTLTEDAIAEMELGMSGLYDPETAVPTGQLKSPNMYLTGDVRETVGQHGRRELQYLVVTMRLYELKTRQIMWQEQARFLKSKKKSGILGF